MTDGFGGSLLPKLLRGGEVRLEGSYVEEVSERGINRVASRAVYHPLGFTECFSEAVEGVVKAATQSGGRGFRPEGEAHLLPGAGRIVKQIEEELPGLRVAELRGDKDTSFEL